MTSLYVFRPKSCNFSQAHAFRSQWLVIALSAIAISTFMVAFRSETMVFNRPLDEDGFYALTVSRFIALGSGITIDGHTMTNGFQPLWVFLNAALYWLVDGDRMLGIRLTLLLHWALYVTTGLVLGLIAARILPRHFKGLSPRIAGLTTALVYLSAPKIWLFSFNGMETSLLLFMTALSVLTYMELSDKGYKGLVACGLVLGLLVLSRIDTAFFVVILSFTQLFRKAPPMQRFVRISMLGESHCSYLCHGGYSTTQIFMPSCRSVARRCLHLALARTEFGWR